MSKRYKCITGWVRHSKGEIIPEHEYSKIPHEIKMSGAFVEVIDTVPPPEPEVIFESPAVDDSPNIVFEEPLDPVLSTVTIDPFSDRKNKNNRR